MLDYALAGKGMAEGKRDRIRIVYELLSAMRSPITTLQLSYKVRLSYDQAARYLKKLELKGCMRSYQERRETRTQIGIKHGPLSNVWINESRGEDKRKMLASIYEDRMFEELPFPAWRPRTKTRN